MFRITLYVSIKIDYNREIDSDLPWCLDYEPIKRLNKYLSSYKK